MILVAVSDLLFASKIDAASRRLGIDIVWAPRNVPLPVVAEERRPRCILADLSQRNMLEMLRAVRAHAPATRVIGFLGHLQADLIDEAHAIGIEDVLTRGKFAASLDDVLRRAATPYGADGGNA
jgi:DNA-binding NarL/FixJ family response regulator